MISNSGNRKIYIKITTYKRNTTQMDKINRKSSKNGKFVCSLCLNAKPDEKSTDFENARNTCPICAKTFDCCVKRNVEDPIEDKTSDTNVKQGLNLLNEVLTVFQHKKEVKSKTRDVGVATEKALKMDTLTISTFQFSIDETRRQENGKFSVINTNQPSYLRKSGIDLIKNKSSSIPQMKLEELKHSMKEKSRSKDAIEEVNRMFAIVKKSEKNDKFNRPMIRSGPRLLPVVKHRAHGGEKDMPLEIDNCCKCCQTCMSSGDSLMKPEYWNERKEKCERCVFMSRHYQNNLRNQKMCERCKSSPGYWQDEKFYVIDD